MACAGRRTRGDVLAACSLGFEVALPVLDHPAVLRCLPVITAQAVLCRRNLATKLVTNLAINLAEHVDELRHDNV